MRRSTLLHGEQLEPRENPATFGTPWPDGRHLTFSFAPDHTAIGGQASNLGGLLAGLGADARLQVLRAFQTWVVEAGLNLGLVNDTGAAFGTGGAVQGDPRFGDIRIGGIRLAPDVLAVTAPYQLYDNYSGDVVVNAAAPYGTGPGADDLFTVLLQEAGHAFGVGNSPDPASVMYEYYRGPRAGLSAGDVASIQSLYGPRTPDQYEGSSGNGTPATATPYPGPVTADLTTTGDVDVYKFTAGLLTNGVTVSLRAAGLSLVAAKVEVLDSAGQVLASAAATDPTHNDITLSLGSVEAGAVYYVRVSSARPDVFGVGAYRLDIQQHSPFSSLTGLAGGLLNDTGLNDTLATATTLLANALAVTPRAEYSTDGSFGSPSDVDVYRITVPPSADGSPVNLLTTVWGTGGTVLNPWVEVYDLFGRKLDTDAITADGNTTTIQARGLATGGTYFLRVSSDTHSVGGYHLSGDVRAEVVALPDGGTGTLDAPHPAAAATLDLAQTGQVHFVLSADGRTTTGAARLVVAADDGTVVARLGVPAGRGRSVDVFLRAGRYRIEVRSGDPSSPVTFKLGLDVVTDPTGATATDPTATPQDPPPPGGSSSTAGTTTSPSDASTTPTTDSAQVYASPDDADDTYWY